MRWAYYWSRGLLLGMMAYCVHGMFHNEEYLEFMFLLVGLNVALQATARRELHHQDLHGALEKADGQRKTSERGASPSASCPHPGLMFGRRRRPRSVAVVGT
jgi:hypothetical protein